MKNLMPIGKFSKLTRLSVKALRLYNEVGLLNPAVVDQSSGYRYYSMAQANEAERIRQLRDLDMPLDEIREVLRGQSFEAIRPLLDSHKKRIEQKIADYEQVLRFLQELMSQEEGMMSYEVKIREITPQFVLSLRVRTTQKKLGEAFGPAFGELFGYLGQIGQPPAGAPFSIYHGEEFNEDDVDVEICVPVAKKLAGKGRLEGREIPGGPVVYTLHSGTYNEIGPAYQALGGWIQEHGHEMTGPPREIYLVGPAEGRDPSEYRTELEWPIKSSVL